MIFNNFRIPEQFLTKYSCRDDFKLKRKKEGVFCKKCKHKDLSWLNGKSQWECKSCKFRTGLKSGSMMENSNLPIRICYLAIFFMTFTKKMHLSKGVTTDTKVYSLYCTGFVML